MASNRGIYHEGWYANAQPPRPPSELAAEELPIDQYKCCLLYTTRCE